MMSAPASASAIAMALPMPRVPPVTRVVLPVRSKAEVIVDSIEFVMVKCGDEGFYP